jgi:hypothetical protein
MFSLLCHLELCSYPVETWHVLFSESGCAIQNENSFSFLKFVTSEEILQLLPSFMIAFYDK